MLAVQNSQPVAGKLTPLPLASVLSHIPENSVTVIGYLHGRGRDGRQIPYRGV